MAMNHLYYVAKVRRSTICTLAVALCAVAGTAWAGESRETSDTTIAEKPLFEVPDFSRGGFVLSLEYSPWAAWSFDQAHLASQVGDLAAGVFIAQAKSQHTASLHMAYNVLAHGRRGLHGHGLEHRRPRPGRRRLPRGHGRLAPAAAGVDAPGPAAFGRVDLKVYFGAGYGIAGQSTGMDGLVTELGFDAMFFFSRYFALGLYGRLMFLQWDKFYLDYYGRDRPGMTIPLPQGSGGTFGSFGFAMHFRAGD